jgi:UPF0755 protein
VKKNNDSFKNDDLNEKKELQENKFSIDIDFDSEQWDQESAFEQAPEQQNELPQDELKQDSTYEDDDNSTDGQQEEETTAAPKSKKRKKKQRSIGGLIAYGGVIVGTSLLLAALILVSMNDILAIFKPDKLVQIEIPKSASTQQISKILKENDIIEFPLLFRFISKQKEADGNYQYGLYTLNSNMSYDQIMEELKKIAPKKDAIKITIKEGETLHQIAKALEVSKVCKEEDFLDVINRHTFDLPFEKYVENNKLKYQRIEGFAFPDTYEFFTGESAESVARKILTNFDKKITQDLWDRMKELNVSLEQTITLASIVQAEAGEIAQMKKVSGVFHNRLDNKDKYPKLESDPTTKYVREDIKPNIKIPNDDIYNAYDTYIGNGLPPGAICNPGLEAIKATLYPENTDYYYFCSNLDTKQFFYAKTLQQHNINLKKAGLR